MATSSFLEKEQVRFALTHFKRLGPQSFGAPFSKWLEDRLLERLSKIEGWQKSQPIALGSWARGELTPNSDIDLLFCGPESEVIPFMSRVQSAGIKVRSRVPENKEDWTEGVSPFDVIALLAAKSFDVEAAEQLQAQQSLIRQRSKEWKKTLLNEMRRERKDRSRRYDSLTQVLEPNLKYGPGGLRDLQQALVVFELFPEKFKGQDRVVELLVENRNFLLSVRQILHLLGGSEILSAAEQLEISSRFEFSDVKQFAREVQLSLERVSFFSDWSLEQVRLSERRKEQYSKNRLASKVGRCLSELWEDPSLSRQWQIREQLAKLWSQEKPDLKQKGKWLQKYVTAEAKEEFLSALFRSGVLEKLVPDVARIKGLVQHDHYHRYTLDAHILQCLKLLSRAYKKPKNLGGLQFIVRDFSEEDWKVMALTALYHDLGKGLGGDHSIKGVELVRRDFKAFGFSDKLIQDICWLVEHHLILSTAAFRRNPQDPSTWRWLHDSGAVGVALRRLALWTWIDIQATNPDAWTTWKSRLLEDLVRALESEGADRFRRFITLVEEKGIRVDRKILEEIDLGTLRSLPLSVLVKDLESTHAAQADASILIKRISPHRCWVRFHRRVDKKGVFLEFVQRLYGAGCTILESSVRTLPEIGVYDWFLVKTSRKPSQLKKTLEMMGASPSSSHRNIRFDQIQMIETSSEEFVISFRGRDQKGMLLAAAQALFDEDLEILWAKVHTWGKQVDDVFGVRAGQKADDVIRRLREKWQHISRPDFDL